MATTLPGSPYVESSDLVANYPAVSESLAERVDLVGVLPFANSAARTTALPTPKDGQYSYLQDTNSTEYYNGTAWVAAGTSPGLVHINTTTFSAVSSVSLNDVFTSSYANYLIIMTATTSATIDGLIRFRTSGTDNTTTVYNSRLFTGSVFGTSDASQGYVWTGHASGYSDLVMHINNPQIASYTLTNYISNKALVGVVHQNAAGTMGFLNSAQFDGFTIYPATGTITGTIRVYGYKNS